MKSQRIEQPLVSVIMPAYNDGENIIMSVKSVLDQTYKNIELIVIDDGSTDNTELLLDAYKNSNLLYRKTENKGASAARNEGFKMAMGEFIQYLDADDIIEGNKIELQLKKMLATDADVSFSLWKDLQLDQTKIAPLIYENINYLKIHTGRDMIKSFGMDNWFIPVFSYLTKRSLIEQAGPWDENLSNNDDGEFFYRALFNADKLVCVDKILGFYRRSTNSSLSNYNSEGKIHSGFASFKKIEQHIRSNDQYELLCYPKRLFYIQFRMLYRQYPKLASRAAKAFDSIQGPCFLVAKKRFWLCIQTFGLEKGVVVYNKLQKGINIYRNIR